MPLFTIERDGSGMTDAERMLGATRAFLCAAGYPGMQWIRSYWDEAREISRCFYVANNAEDILYHAAMSGISCVAAREVTEFRHDGSGKIVAGEVDLNQKRPADGALRSFVARLKLGGQADEAVVGRPWPSFAPGQPGLVRGFIDREVDELFAVLSDVSLDAARSLAMQSDFEALEVYEVAEFFPSDVEFATSPAPTL